MTQAGFLASQGVTHVLSVCTDENLMIPRREPSIVHARVPVEDADSADLLIWLPWACKYIHDVLASRGTLLVHSTEGRSRAAAVVAAYRALDLTNCV